MEDTIIEEDSLGYEEEDDDDEEEDDDDDEEEEYDGDIIALSLLSAEKLTPYT